MRTLLAKLKVSQVTDFGNDNLESRLTAVSGESEENKTFSKYTPRADVNILVNNPDNTDFFKAGEEVYITFSKERPVFNRYTDLLSYALEVLENPGKYNNSELHNLKTSIKMILRKQLLDEVHEDLENAKMYRKEAEKKIEQVKELKK